MPSIPPPDPSKSLCFGSQKLVFEKGALEIPASGVFSRADAQLITIFDKEMNKAYKIKDRRNDFLKILGAILTDALEGNEGDKNVS